MFVLKRGQLWTGCADSADLFLWHINNHKHPFKRISLPGISGITCMIQVKNQVSYHSNPVLSCFQWSFVVLLSLLSPLLRSGWAVEDVTVLEVSVTVSWEVRCWWWTWTASRLPKSFRLIQTAFRPSAPPRIATSWAALQDRTAGLPSGESSEKALMCFKL